MTLRTYQAPTMAEALAEVKRDLGREAVILHTRSVRKGGFLGLWGRNQWEVTASGNVNVPARIPPGSYVSQAVADEARPRVAEPLAKPSPSLERTALRGGQFLSGQVTEIRRMIETLLARASGPGGGEGEIPPTVREFHAHLLSQDVHEATVGEIVRELCMDLTGQQLGDPKLIRAELQRMLAQYIRTASDEVTRGTDASTGPHVMALIGPTGVGKTTTIAKLAANYKLRTGMKVGLITIDTYRIAAVDQLRTYADIIEVPLVTVLTAGELNQAVRGMQGMDVVLIDTAGRSQNNDLRLNQLQSFLGAAEADEVDLVVSATGSPTCTRRILDRFLPLGATGVIVTKLDEAATFGAVVNVSDATGRPIRYVTTGQDVPDDISPANSAVLAEWVLAGQYGDEANAG